MPVALELPRISGKGKVKVFMGVDARHLEGHPEICIHHDPMSGERWTVSVKACGYKIATINRLEEAEKLILKLLIVGTQHGIEWEKMDLETFKALSEKQRSAVAVVLQGKE
jgi:hypothetical protein